MGLWVNDLTVAYHRKPVLWDIELTLPEGRLIAVVRPNGAGKSTFIKAVLGLVPRASGAVTIYGKSYEAQRHLVGYVPQRESVDWDFPVSALDVVAMGLYRKIGWLRPVGSQHRRTALDALEKVGMATRMDAGNAAGLSSFIFGLILVVALLIIPAASARFWTFRLGSMVWLAGLFGALSGFLGSGISALMANLPAGAVIVLTASSFFVISMVFGSARGLLHLGLGRIFLRRKIMDENLLRDIHKWSETVTNHDDSGPSIDQLMARRAWAPRALRHTVNRLEGRRLIRRNADRKIQMTPTGVNAAKLRSRNSPGGRHQRHDAAI